MLSEERTLVRGAGGEPIRAKAERLAEARGPPLEELKRHLKPGYASRRADLARGRDLSTGTLRNRLRAAHSGSFRAGFMRIQGRPRWAGHPRRTRMSWKPS